MAQSKPSVNIAINTLVLRAGQSLRWINLDPIAEENPLLYSAMPPEVAQSLVLRCSVDVINQHESYVAPIVERLNQVASASISDIHLAFHIANEVFLPKLCDSLAQIDTALCGTVLYSARLVKISLCGVASSKQIAKAKNNAFIHKDQSIERHHTQDREGVPAMLEGLGQEQPVPVLGLCGVTGQFCLVFSRFDVIFKRVRPL
ncbi:predicted protein [Postia placenta Mad-698-R]|nr:predicted protein [Postia placenta Mad-698-R]